MSAIIVVVLIVVIGVTSCILGIKYIDYIKHTKECELELTRETAKNALEQARDETEKERVRLENEVRKQSLDAKMGAIIKIGHYLYLTERSYMRMVSKLNEKEFSELDLDNPQIVKLFKLAYEEGHEEGFNYCKKEVVNIIS